MFRASPAQVSLLGGPLVLPSPARMHLGVEKYVPCVLELRQRLPTPADPGGARKPGSSRQSGVISSERFGWREDATG